MQATYEMMDFDRVTAALSQYIYYMKEKNELQHRNKRKYSGQLKLHVQLILEF